MLLSAGYSLGAALNRLAARGRRRAARDLAASAPASARDSPRSTPCGSGPTVADVDALGRLVPVLALNREAGDLGRLVVGGGPGHPHATCSAELVETIERRGQQVWIPVTVATLVPGVIFLAVPFVEAMRLFASAPDHPKEDNPMNDAPAARLPAGPGPDRQPDRRSGPTSGARASSRRRSPCSSWPPSAPLMWVGFKAHLGRRQQPDVNPNRQDRRLTGPPAAARTAPGGPGGCRPERSERRAIRLRRSPEAPLARKLAE